MKAALWTIGITLLVGLQTALYAQQASMDMTYYSGGKGKLELESMPARLEYEIPLRGKTTLKTVMFKFSKKNGPERSVIMPLSVDGTFKARWLLKDGPGEYTVTIFGSEQVQSLRYAGIAYFNIISGAAVPANLPGLAINSSVMAFVDSVMGTQVGRGECWDLAQAALDKHGADWKRPVSYGVPLIPGTDEVMPGDIMQFKTLKLTEKLPNGGTRWETLGAPDHTAVVYEVLGPMRYRLAHQNIGGSRIVQITELNLSLVTSGQYWMYRPQAGLILE